MLCYGARRHGTMNSFKDTVTKTVQMFKLTHQDRWNEFKLSFSREQLEDLQVGSTSQMLHLILTFNLWMHCYGTYFRVLALRITSLN